MKGLILAGGTGSRLRPITYTLPKQMLPIAGKPVLEHAVEKIRRAGIDEVGIVLGEHGHEAIKSYFGDGSGFGIDITYIHQGEPLGLAHAVGCAEQFVGDDPFVLYLGDDLIQQDLSEFVDRFDPETQAGSLAVQHVADPSRYGIVNVNDDNEIVGLIEKPDDPPTDMAAIGIFILTPLIFERIREIDPSWRGELELTDAIQRAITDGEQFTVYTVDGWWRDVGTPEDVIESNYLALDDLDPDLMGVVEDEANVKGRVHAEPGSVIKSGATVVGPVYLGEGATIESGTYIGPFTTIAAECTIDGCRIEQSVVLRGSEIETDQQVSETLIGRNVTVVDRQDGRNELLLGNDATVRL